MKRLVLVLVITSLVSAPVSAQEIPEPPQIPPGEDRVEHLEEGTRAPYEGMLLGMDTAIRWTNQLRWWPEAFQLQFMEHLDTLAIERESYEMRLELLDDSRSREIQGLREDLRSQSETYEERIARLEDPPFWQTAWFGFIGGVVLVGGAVAVGAVLAAQ